MTHAWSIIIVLTVSAVLFYAGVFEAAGRPRFEGLAASSLRPMPEQVQLYSDGILVLAIANTKPYKFTFDWVEVAPIANQDDMIRTNLGGEIPQGGIGIYYINGTNLLGGISGAAVFMLPAAAAGEDTVDFHYRHQESYHAAGSSNTYTTPWAKAHQITVNPENSPSGSGGGSGSGLTGCQRHRACECTEPQGLVCQGCWEGSDFIMKWDNYGGCTYITGEPTHVCWTVGEYGDCIPANSIPCSEDYDCPLMNCQTCIEGTCNNYETCGAGFVCTWDETATLGYCKEDS